MPVINFVWDELGDNVLSEVDDVGVKTASYTNEPGEFGTLLSQTRSGTSSFFHFDGQGSTRQITNASEAETDSYSYSAFGEKISSSGSTTNPFQYNGAAGYYSDAETGDVYVRRRAYSPQTARWLSVDPLMFVDGPNNYSYVRNRPIGFRDPSGLFLACCSWSETTGRLGTINSATIECKSDLTDSGKLAAAKCCERYIKKKYGRDGTRLGSKPSPCDGPKRPTPPVDLINYGHYCGMWRMASCKDGIPDVDDRPPIDDLDCACAYHDCCLPTKREYFNAFYHWGCNYEFCVRIHNVRCDLAVDPRACESFRKRARALTCGTLVWWFPLP